MTPTEFKKARQELGLTASQLGHILNTDPPTIRKWEADEARKTSRNVNPIAARAMRWMLGGFRPPEWPEDK